VEIFTPRYAAEWVAPDDDDDDDDGGRNNQGNNLMYSKLYLRNVLCEYLYIYGFLYNCINGLKILDYHEAI